MPLLDVTQPGPAEPAKNCPLCPRLIAFRAENQHAHPDWFNGAVPSFGPDTARLLLVGLAPGLKGANRTGRPFLGDHAGELLYRTLLKTGLARGVHEVATPERLELVDCMITNAVRCVPPQNKPTPDEIKRCRQFLIGRMATLPRASRLERLAGARQVGHAFSEIRETLFLRRSPMAGLEISPTKVGFVIVKARELAAKVGAWDDGATSDHDAESILEDFSDDATLAELKEFIRDLNEDEQVSLVALAWIGRGSFGPEEVDDALETARAERTSRTEDYLLGIPLLPDYLEEALDKLGYSVEDAEDDAMGD